MKIRTQFIVTMLFFGVVLVVIATSLFFTFRQAAGLTEQEKLAQNIEQGAFELSYLGNDYLIYRESQQKDRWETRFASLSEDVATLQPGPPEQESLINNIRVNKDRLKAVFDDIASSSARSPGSPVDTAAAQVSWSRMAVQNQGIIFDASLVARMIRDRIERMEHTTFALIIALTAFFAIYFISNYLLMFRRTLKSISVLRSGTEIVGAGNLDHTIEMKQSDEIGALSRSFNRMTARLKDVTASRADLEREIADRKKAEEGLRRRTLELEASNEELESFSYTVSHDLRAPLRIMDGFSQALLEDYAGKLDEQGKDWLHKIRTSSQLMAQLIDDILGLSKIVRTELRLQTIDMSELARLIALRLKETFPGRQVDFDIAPGMESTGDENLLRAALENLLDNAFKFTSRCQNARIEFKMTRRDGREVYFVRDNGAGFDMSYVDKLFKPFQRLHSANEFPGSGIGLVTVQRIIKRHGGEVWAEGETGKGATIYFTVNQQ